MRLRERDDFVGPYFKHAKNDAVVVILKAREPARIMIAIGAQDRWHLQLAQRWIVQYNFYINPSFSTGGVDDPGNRSRTISWSKGLPHKSDILALTQKLSARADARRRLGRQGEVQLFEQESVIGFGMGVAA